jgi:hypothetical protein
MRVQGYSDPGPVASAALEQFAVHLCAVQGGFETAGLITAKHVVDRLPLTLDGQGQAVSRQVGSSISDPFWANPKFGRTRFRHEHKNTIYSSAWRMAVVNSANKNPQRLTKG